MQQKTIQIGEVDVPIIIDGGEEWFPISYISNKVLLRKNNNLINKDNRNKYQDHLHKYIIKFEEKNIQESNCIDKKGLIEVLKSTHLGRLTSEQRLSQNLLHNYLGIDSIFIDEQDVKEYKKEWFNEVDDYTKEIIINELKIENVEWIRVCSKCSKHYPLTKRFFPSHNKANKKYSKICRVCSGHQEYFKHHNEDMKSLKKLDLYEKIKEDSIFSIYEAYRNKELKRLPDCYENKESYEKIIRELFYRGELTVNNLTSDFITKKCRLSGVYRYMNISDIYKFLFGDDFYLYAWKYPNFKFKSIKLTYDIANQIIKNYIKENNLIIDDIFIYDYDQLIKECSLTQIAAKDILKFIVQFYEYSYAGYLFKTQAVNYYKDDDNLLFDLKYLIEQDMELDIDKIPLYLTKTVLHRKSVPLYNYIIAKKNGTIFEWVNKLYPNKFIETDFEVNAYREEFGSDTECFIHDILKENFKNVIYNQIHTSRTIEINGMIPDWLIMTDTGVYIVEYFGLYEERSYGENSRVTDYIDKTKRKIEKYKQMNGYRFIFFYPNDIENDFEGCRDIIAKVKENPYLSMV